LVHADLLLAKKGRPPGKKADVSGAPDKKRLKEQEVIRQVWTLAEPVCISEGLELIQVEYQRESTGRILRLFVDKSGGVKLDDCVVVSRQLNDILDVHLEAVGPYNLEVTSPGPERPLARKYDFDKFKGHRSKIKTIQPLDGRRNFTGMLLGISADVVSLEVDGQVVAIDYANISKARLIE
jgi:ribosome maturation factor RimP